MGVLSDDQMSMQKSLRPPLYGAIGMEADMYLITNAGDVDYNPSGTDFMKLTP